MGNKMPTCPYCGRDDKIVEIGDHEWYCQHCRKAFADNVWAMEQVLDALYAYAKEVRRG